MSMDYREENGEVVITKARIHWSVYLLPAVLTVVLGLIYEGLALFGVVWLVYEAVSARNVELVVSSKRIHGKYGIVNTKQIDVLLNRVGDINIQKGMLGSILGYGKLEIRTGTGEFVFKKIADPETFRNTVLNAADQMEEGRFTRQSDRFENAIYQQTAMQIKAAEQIIGSVESARLPNKEESQSQLLQIQDPELELKEPAAWPNMSGEGVVRKKIEWPLWKDGSPVLIKSCFIEELLESHQLQVRMSIQNLFDAAIEALYLDIQGFDVLKEEKCFLKKIPMLDLDILSGKSYTLLPIKLPDTSIRRINIYVRYVVFANEQVWNCREEEPFREIRMEQKPYGLEYRCDIEKLANENGLMERGICQYTYQPIYEDNYWVCGCQQFNIGDICTNCGIAKEVIQNVFQPELIEERHQNRMKLEKEEKERIRQEQERQKAEEERLHREQEEEKRRLKEMREEQMRQMVQQMQCQAGKLMDAVKSGAENLKDGTMQKTGNFKKAISNQVDDLLEEARRENEKKNCLNCGAVNDGNAKFCTKCGHSMKDKSKTESDKEDSGCN